MVASFISLLQIETPEEKLLRLTTSHPTGISRWEIERVLSISGNKLGELLKNMSKSECEIVARRMGSRSVKDVILTPLGVENLCKAVKQTRITKTKVHSVIELIPEKIAYKTFRVMQDICGVKQREWRELLGTDEYLFQKVKPDQMWSSMYISEDKLENFMTALKKLRSTRK